MAIFFPKYNALVEMTMLPPPRMLGLATFWTCGSIVLADHHLSCGYGNYSFTENIQTVCYFPLVYGPDSCVTAEDLFRIAGIHLNIAVLHPAILYHPSC